MGLQGGGGHGYEVSVFYSLGEQGNGFKHSYPGKGVCQ